LVDIQILTWGLSFDDLYRDALDSTRGKLLKYFLCVIAVCVFLPAIASLAGADTVCTIVVSAKSGRGIIEEGDCDLRMSPASTFKVAISLMGFDTGILQSVDEPKLPFKKNYIAARSQWRQAITPRSWMRDSVIWYSQQVTSRLGLSAMPPMWKPLIMAIRT
tara:strand:+ start:22398 stop:22883 length:486 start_codon:yes stop_codon:yes gene_type:complete